MLKAVRFDPESHKDLIDYIENYRDKKGKPNHSEAIRILMEKGFKALHSETSITIKEPINPDIDLNKFKEEIVKEIWETIGKNVVVQPPMPASHVFTQVNTPIIEQPKKELPKEPVKPKISPAPVPSAIGGNSLLANMLGNATRG